MPSCAPIKHPHLAPLLQIRNSNLDHKRGKYIGGSWPMCRRHLLSTLGLTQLPLLPSTRAFALSEKTLAKYIIFHDQSSPSRSRQRRDSYSRPGKVETSWDFLFVFYEKKVGGSTCSWLPGVRVQPRSASLGTPTTRQLGSSRRSWAARKPENWARRLLGRTRSGSQRPYCHLALLGDPNPHYHKLISDI